MLTSRQNLRHRGACGITRACRDRGMPGSIPAFCKFHHVLSRRAGANAHHIHDRMPITEELPDLLGIEFKQQRNSVIVSVRLSLDIRHIDRPARNRVQYAHQCALRIAIVDMESVHLFSVGSATAEPGSAGQPGVAVPTFFYSSSNIISDNAAPAGTIGNTFASGCVSNTSSSGSDEFKKRSSSSPVSFETGNSRTTDSLIRCPWIL